MGLYLSIGETEEEENIFSLGSGIWYSEFLNYCAEREDITELLWFTPGVSVALKNHKGPRSMEVFSMDELLREVNRVILDDSDDVPGWCVDRAKIWRAAIERAEQLDDQITLD